MNANEKQTLHLPAGQVLSIAAASGASGSAIRLAKMPGGGDAQSITAITTGATFTFGPYAQTERFEIICTAGVLTITTEAKELDNDGTLAANSDSLVPTQKAVKTYVDALLPLLDALTYQGVISALATFPAASRGHLYKITAVGAIGGTGPTVAVGDMAICNTDATVAGTYADVGTKWDIIPATNIDTLSDLIAATAEDDVIVAGPSPFAWVKKTIGQFKAILGLGTAAYTNSSNYVGHSSAIAENDILVGAPDPFGSWVKKTIAEFKTILGLGTAAYTASTAYDVAGAAAGIVASAITDGDTTHCPDGNSVFDALALKLDKAQATPTILQLPEKTPVNAVASTGTLTSGGTNPTDQAKAIGVLTSNESLVADGETVTIGETVYAFKTALTTDPATVPNEVLIGANYTEQMHNLYLAIMGETGEGTNYSTGTVAHADVVSSDVDTAAITVTAREFGAAGNLIAKGTDSTNLDWDGTGGYLTGGLDLETVTIDTKTYTFKAVLTPVEGEVLIGATNEASLTNLKNAINHTGTPDTDYSCAEAHPTVTATASDATTVTLAAKTKGVSGDAIVTTETMVDAAFGSGTLGSGVDSTTGKDREMCADADYYYISFGESTITTQNWRQFAKGEVY
jgi:hypothetical protein